MAEQMRMSEAEFDRRQQYMYELGRAAGWQSAGHGIKKLAAELFIQGKDQLAHLLREQGDVASGTGDAIESSAREKNKVAEAQKAARKSKKAT